MSGPAHVAGPLDHRQIDDFVHRGFTTLRRAFDASLALSVRQALGRRIGVDLDGPRTWEQPRVWLQENLRGPPFVDPVNDTFVAAVDQLVGPGRWTPRREMGWWPVTFPGFADPPYGGEWHVEGDFAHHLWSPEQAVLSLFCFSDVDVGGGGTSIAVGSHRLVADVLRRAPPSGLDNQPLRDAVGRAMGGGAWDVVEVTARAGDVILAHPLVFHASSPNHGDRPRVMAQPRFDMTEPKRIRGEGLFPVEVPLLACR